MSIDLNAPEVQEAIKAAVDAAIKPLAEKRDELLGEVKKLRKESTIKPEDLEAVEKERDELKSALTAAQKEAKQLADAAKKADEALKAESAFNHRLLVENGLTDELTKAGVTNPAFLKAVKSTLASQVAVVVEGDTRIAKAGDKPLSEFVKEWASSDEGKFFVTAPENSGSGASGNNGKQFSTNKKASEMNVKEKATYIKENGINAWNDKVKTDYAPA
jgi:DNA-binding helix-hairpin-helix protein with protein kinase domain